MSVLAISASGGADENDHSVESGPMGSTIHKTTTPTTDKVQVRKDVGPGHVFIEGKTSNPHGRDAGGSLGGTNPHNDADKQGTIGVGTDF